MTDTQFIKLARAAAEEANAKREADKQREIVARRQVCAAIIQARMETYGLQFSADQLAYSDGDREPDKYSGYDLAVAIAPDVSLEFSIVRGSQDLHVLLVGPDNRRCAIYDLALIGRNLIEWGIEA